MSLKAKLEAVVYAAEEPVTLAQLAALFAAEALEWKAAQEAVSAEAESGEASSVADPSPLLNAELSDEAMEQPSNDLIEADRNEASASDGVPSPLPAPEPSMPGPDAPEPATAKSVSEARIPSVPEAAGEPAAEPPVDAEVEAKRLTRQRDREVKGILRQLMDELIATYASDDRGIEIKEIAGGYRMATKPECHDAARQFVKSLKPALKLSLPALETLAVIAYKQPVTAPEVNEIRGVDSSGVFGSLLARKLIATAGRKQVIGRPILYKTTKEFLLRFGLKDVSELPSMEEFEKMAELEFEETEAGGSPEQTGELDFERDMNSEEGLEGSETEVSQENGKQAEGETQPGSTESRDHAETESHPPQVVSTAPLDVTTAEDAPAAPSALPEQEENEAVSHE